MAVYRLEAEVSVRHGPWEPYWVEVRDGGAVPSAGQGAAVLRRHLMDVHGTRQVRIRGTQVVEASGSVERRA